MNERPVVTLQGLTATSADDIERGLRGFAGRESASIQMECRERVLLIGASSGLFVTNLMIPRGGIFNMLASDRPSGSVDFLLDGQLTTNYPRKWLITCEQAIRAGREFWETGTIEVTEEWEDQQDHVEEPPPPASSDDEIIRMYRSGDRLEAIAAYRRTYGVGLREAKQALERRAEIG